MKPDYDRYAWLSFSAWSIIVFALGFAAGLLYTVFTRGQWGPF